MRNNHLSRSLIWKIISQDYISFALAIDAYLIWYVYIYIRTVDAIAVDKINTPNNVCSFDIAN